MAPVPPGSSVPVPPLRCLPSVDQPCIGHVNGHCGRWCITSAHGRDGLARWDSVKMGLPRYCSTMQVPDSVVKLPTYLHTYIHEPASCRYAPSPPSHQLTHPWSGWFVYKRIRKYLQPKLKGSISLVVDDRQVMTACLRVRVGSAFEGYRTYRIPYYVLRSSI